MVILLSDLELEKNKLRQFYLKKRASITKKRYKEAQNQLTNLLKKRFEKETFILSFASKSSEISLWELNEFLANQNSLILPKCNKHNLDLYLVKNINKDLRFGNYKIKEPIPFRCQDIDSKYIKIALIPFLTTCSSHHRLGYGKGFYDRFLKKNPHIHSIGIGFKELFSPTPLPTNTYDQTLKEVILF
jgi:5-formyltetrahydrofolate cyclo-ligase